MYILLYEKMSIYLCQKMYKQSYLLQLVFGVLFFFLGCAMDSTMIEGFGAIVLVPGLIGLLEKLWPEEVKG